ncbi:hypothetical protein D3C80_2107090 [compost metagenome]
MPHKQQPTLTIGKPLEQVEKLKAVFGDQLELLFRRGIPTVFDSGPVSDMRPVLQQYVGNLFDA